MTLMRPIHTRKLSLSKSFVPLPWFSMGLLLLLLGMLFHTPVYAVVITGPGHMDIDMNIDEDGQWSFALSHDGAGSGFEGGDGDGSFHRPADTETVIYIPGTKSFNRPSASTWNFLGVDAGESVWIFPQIQDEDFVWPGLNTEGTATSSIDTWQPSHALLTAPGQYMELRLLDMDYYGEGTDNNFSLWVTGTFGTPNAWMSSADGIDDQDSYFMLPGGHSHMNWGFTSLGIYDLTFEARTMQDGNLIVSDPFTLRFGVGVTDVVPEPGRALLLLAGMAGVIFRRKRP